MRYLILTDMHGNFDAMLSVLRKVRRKRFDATLVLGDLVGYGASPNQVVEEMARLHGRVFCVRGNHDKVAAGIDDGTSFNEVALAAARWTTERLTPENLRYVRALPEGPMVVEENNGAPSLAICHGSPAHEDTYLFSEAEALDGFRAEPAAHVTFFGHTHLPSLFVQHANGIRPVLLRGSQGRIRIHPKLRYLINPGSVGQPRDRNPLAAYMTYDSAKQIVRWYRISYPIKKAQERIISAGLPPVLAERLQFGL